MFFYINGSNPLILVLFVMIETVPTRIRESLLSLMALFLDLQNGSQTLLALLGRAPFAWVEEKEKAAAADPRTQQETSVS